MVYYKLFSHTSEERFGGEKEGWSKWIDFFDQGTRVGNVTTPCGPPDIDEVQGNEIGMET